RSNDRMHEDSRNGARRWRTANATSTREWPNRSRSTWGVQLRFGYCLRDVARAEAHLMAEFHEFAANRSSDRTRSQDTDFQRYAPRPPDDPDVLVGFRWRGGPYFPGERAPPDSKRRSIAAFFSSQVRQDA